MDIVYKNKNVESVCVDYRVAKRRYNSKIAEKLFAALELIRNAESIMLLYIRRFIFMR